MRRKIKRGAMLLYERPDSPQEILLEIRKDLQEVAAKGYDAVEIFPLNDEIDWALEVCREAAAYDLEVWVLTGYMKYQQKYLAAHPDQRMMTAADALRGDNVATSNLGCPYNADFKAPYLEFLRELVSQPGVTRIGLNDEASLNSGCYCSVCSSDYAEETGREIPVKVDPVQEDWQDEEWRQYLEWRMGRWNRLHGELAEYVRSINPNLTVIFQTSPACDLWRNPWETAVNLSTMIDSLDGLSTDPYYTFHARHFHPAEVYMSEWSRFLRGIVPPEKETEIVVQGFSHPTFSRPLGRDDGYWSSLVPLACGIDIITPYTYAFQRCSPSQATYEACFPLDRYFEKAEPLKYIGVVHGGQTEIYTHPLPTPVPASYDWTRLLPVTEALRHHGLPYSYLADNRLNDEMSYADFPVLVLPEVDSLSPAQAQGLQQYIEAGGNLVILGGLGTADETGTPKPTSLLEELFGIRLKAETPQDRLVCWQALHPAVGDLEAVNTLPVGEGSRGVNQPLLGFKHCVAAQLPAGAQVLAEFTDANGNPTGEAAVVALQAPGRVLWCAGFPSRTIHHPLFNITVTNKAHALLPALIAWAAGGKPNLRVENWPPQVPLAQLRPFDIRNMSSFEFFPLQGEELAIALITSYFKEPAAFPLIFDVPAGKRLKRIFEGIENREVDFSLYGAQATIQVELGFDSAALLYVFELET